MPMMNPMDMNPDMYSEFDHGINPINPAMNSGMFPSIFPCMFPGLNPDINPINPVTNPIIKPFINSDINPGLSPMNPSNNTIMMLNKMKEVNHPNTLLRLSKEFKLCLNDSELMQIGCSFGLVNPGDLFLWKVAMIGPKGTPYESGVFILNIKFPPNYPEKGAEFRFVNKIYHLNVDWRERDDKGNPGNGHICLTTLNEWKSTGKVKDKPGFCVKQALFDIFCLFYNQGIQSPYDDNIAAQYQNNRDEFDRIAKEWTRKYA